MNYLIPWMDGEWAEWLRRLRGKSGVYVVRELSWGDELGDVLYVGEAHGVEKSGDLYRTITRHMQDWNGPTAGASWSRRDVLIGVEVLPPGQAKARQAALIAKLKPRLNKLLLGEGAEGWTPF